LINASEIKSAASLSEPSEIARALSAEFIEWDDMAFGDAAALDLGTEM